MNKKKIKLIANIIIFTLLALVAGLALMVFAMLGEGERINLHNDKPSPAASPK